MLRLGGFFSCKGTTIHRPVVVLVVDLLFLLLLLGIDCVAAPLVITRLLVDGRDVIGVGTKNAWHTEYSTTVISSSSSSTSFGVENPSRDTADGDCGRHVAAAGSWALCCRSRSLLLLVVLFRLPSSSSSSSSSSSCA